MTTHADKVIAFFKNVPQGNVECPSCGVVEATPEGRCPRCRDKLFHD